MPKDEFNKASIAFLQYQTQYGNVVSASARSVYNSRSKFLCYLEDKGHSNFDSITLKVFSMHISEYTKNYSKTGTRSIVNRLKTFFAVLGGDNKCIFHTKLDYSVAVPVVCAPHKYVRNGFNAEQISCRV